MMESEQDKSTSEWKQLHAELEEVRDKRDRLQAANNRVAIRCGELRAECDNLKGAAVDSSGQVASLRDRIQILDAALQEMTAQRDTMTRYRDEMRISRDEARQSSRDLWTELERVKATHASASRMVEALQGDCDAAREELARAKEAADMFEAENAALRDTVRTLRAKQIHPDLSGILCAIQLAAEQARELI